MHVCIGQVLKTEHSVVQDKGFRKYKYYVRPQCCRWQNVHWITDLQAREGLGLVLVTDPSNPTDQKAMTNQIHAIWGLA